jgi:putative DNA primase/helicase
MILRDRTLVRDLAAALTARDFFARTRGGALYRYQFGIYRPEASFFIRQQVKRLLLDEDCSDRWSRALANEVIEFILLDAPELPDAPPMRLINFENGVFDLRSGVLLPHAPEFLMTVRIPLVYNREAVCPEIDRFVAEIFPPDAPELG